MSACVSDGETRRSKYEERTLGMSERMYCIIISQPSTVTRYTAVDYVANLMSADASKASQILGQIYNLYGAPFEIIVGTVFLYQ